MKTSLWLRLLVIVAFFQFFSLGALEWVRTAPASQELILGVNDQGQLLIYGINLLGWPQTHTFNTLPELEAFLKKQKLKLPSICDACPQRSNAQQQAAQLHTREDTNAVVWPSSESLSSRQNEKQTMGLHLTDAQSAQLLTDYLRFQGLSPSPIGFAIRIN